MLRKSAFFTMASLAGLWLPSSGFALVQGEVLVGYSLGYDDNIGLNSQDQGREEDISNEIYFDVALNKTTGFFRYDVFTRAGFIAHSARQVEDQFNVSGGANALWLVIPNRLSWDISNISEIRRRNVQAIASGSNIEQTNVFQTGPTLYFRPLTRTTLDIGAYYQQAWYEFGNANEYVGLTADAHYRYSSLTDFDFALSEVHYLPDGNGFSDQASRSLAVRLNRRIQRGGWFIGAGVSQVVVDGVQATDDAEGLIPTYTAGYSYQLTRTWEFGVSANRQVITIGEDALDSPQTRSLLDSIDSVQAGSLTPGSQATASDLDSLRTEIDEFQYAAGFNINDTLDISLRWRDGPLSAQVRGFARRVEVPEFQLDLSQDARRLLFPEANIDAGQDTYGLEFSVSLEPRLRWLVDAGISVENRDLKSLDILAPSASLGNVSTQELRETRLFSNVTFAASRYLSFGGTVESAQLQDRVGTADDVRSNRVLLTVEYSL